MATIYRVPMDPAKYRKYEKIRPVKVLKFAVDKVFILVNVVLKN